MGFEQEHVDTSSESHEATGCPVPVTGFRTSPRGVGLPCRVFTDPGSGPLVARTPHALGAETLGSGVFPGPATRCSEKRRVLSWASAPLQGFRPVAPADPLPGRLLP
jgi:hypothetical protein